MYIYQRPLRVSVVNNELIYKAYMGKTLNIANKKKSSIIFFEIKIVKSIS